MNAPAQLTEAEQAYDIANKYQGDCRGHLTPDEQLLVCHQFVKLRALLAVERKPEIQRPDLEAAAREYFAAIDNGCSDNFREAMLEHRRLLNNLRAALATGPSLQAHSKSEYKRMSTLGANVLQPDGAKEQGEMG